MRISLIIIFLVLVTLEYQNCIVNTQLNFGKQRQSLSSASMVDGPGIYDGKPENGYYCRVYESMSCQSQVKNLQGLARVDDLGIHLIQDGCTSASTNFLASDTSVKFTSLAPNYIGITRGIFRKCEVSTNSLPAPPTEMTDAFCTSKEKDVAVILNKNILSTAIDFTLTFRDTTGVRSATGHTITKTISSNGSSYFSVTQDFTLTIDRSNSQTSQGHLQAVVDKKSLNLKLECRQANPEPTVVIEKDMELSSTWIDTSRLVGYWKLNEPNATNGAVVMDSSSFAAHGALNAGDGLVKSDSSVTGGALSFDGTNDFVSVSYPIDGHLDFGTRSFTYMVWIRKTGNTSNFDMPLWHGGNSNTNIGFDIECGAGSMGCGALISDGQGLPTSLSFARFADGSSLIGRWVLLTAVIDRELRQLRTYLDEVLISTSDISNLGSVTNSLPLHIGSGFSSSYFLGSIDDVSIWSGVLSNAEIAEIFQRLRPKFY